MKRILYLIRQAAYTVYSFCFFLCLAIELTVRGFLMITLCGATDENKLKYHRLLQRRARFVVNHIPGTTFTYDNTVGETFEKPAVIVSNHQSHLDLMAIIMLTPKLIILTKGWVWHNPFYGIVIRYADYFPISDTENMATVVEEKVGKGYSVVIFPEGTRSPDCHIQRFHRGAFYLAEKIGLDIIPVFIKGFGQVLPKTSWHLHPGRMSLEVMPRIRRDVDGQTIGYREMTRKLHGLYVKKNDEEVCSHR
ncbi:MAG: 1-acyl-sn-glycerol-3-phosphate acyltransferase [Prevotella sp.]|nr:1-acyl-sn-glycerol-3-phosphate acyltransferase [Prevotella sp.]